MKTTYLSCADTARLVRTALKKTFPRTKFSVKSHTYSGGASINVGWTDGPAEIAVSAVTGQFKAGGFDGSIDLAYSMTHWLLPDGTAFVASNPGTQGSGGFVAPEREWMPAADATLVHFGANFIHTNRRHSAAMLRRIIDRLARKGHDMAGLEIIDSSFGATVRDSTLSHIDRETTVYRAAAATACLVGA